MQKTWLMSWKKLTVLGFIVILSGGITKATPKGLYESEGVHNAQLWDVLLTEDTGEKPLIYAYSSYCTIPVVKRVDLELNLVSVQHPSCFQDFDGSI